MWVVSEDGKVVGQDIKGKVTALGTERAPRNLLGKWL
jgi:hypothetical protein